MQGRQNASNSERKGPHKSMHCKFCKPPGVVTPERSTRPQLETKTKIHLTHEAADLRVCDIQDEPGSPGTEACMCVLEGENSCPKCVPDKKRANLKKRVCRCPKGAKPNPNVDDGTTPKMKKVKAEDDEFWWERYDREHDALARETWAAYMAQRRKEKKLAKCQKREQEKLKLKKTLESPHWYQKLSCQQMIYVEFLSTAIRLDSDENITDRTYFVLGGIGLYPRPKRKTLKKCLRYCHYNSIQFLNQLHLLTKDEDIFNERTALPPRIENTYTWNERLIMNAICHLEFPMLLRELMDRLPALPRDKILPQIPYPVFPKLPKKKYENPYEEPIWQDRVNWVEKMKIDRINRCRTNMDTKRVKIPPLALVRRPSLIDARPPFLAQIEANEKASRRVQKQEEKKIRRKHPVSTFNSSVDVTAIAGIEASDISTTDRADTDDICVFLREPLKEPELMDEDELEPEKDVKFLQEEPEVVTTEIGRIKPFFDMEDSSEQEDVELPFKTPPKTESGATIEQPCIPPKSSPGPPAIHYDVAKRELDIINEELCTFHPFVSSSTQTIKADNFGNDDEVTLQLMSAAEKLKQFAQEDTVEKEEKMGKKRSTKVKRKSKCKKKKKNKHETGSNRKSQQKSFSKKKSVSAKNGISSENLDKTREEEEEETECDEMDEKMVGEDGFDGDDFLLSFLSNKQTEKKKLSRKESIVSDPDPDYEDEWASRPICAGAQDEAEEKPLKKKKKKLKGNKKKCKKTKSVKEKVEKAAGPVENLGQVPEPGEMAKKVEKETMTECYPGQFDHLYSEGKRRSKELTKKATDQENVFEGELQPLLRTIIHDLADEGFVSANYGDLVFHPDITQLVQYLRGEIVTKAKRETMFVRTKVKWAKMAEMVKFQIPDLGISRKQVNLATWKDKTWISRIADAKKDEFYFKAASARANYSREVYKTLCQQYFGTGRYLKIYYAYMLPKYEEAILKGIV